MFNAEYECLGLLCSYQKKNPCSNDSFESGMFKPFCFAWQCEPMSHSVFVQPLGCLTGHIKTCSACLSEQCLCQTLINHSLCGTQNHTSCCDLDNIFKVRGSKGQVALLEKLSFVLLLHTGTGLYCPSLDFYSMGNVSGFPRKSLLQQSCCYSL